MVSPASELSELADRAEEHGLFWANDALSHTRLSIDQRSLEMAAHAFTVAQLLRAKSKEARNNAPD